MMGVLSALQISLWPRGQGLGLTHLSLAKFSGGVESSSFLWLTLICVCCVEQNSQFWAFSFQLLGPRDTASPSVGPQLSVLCWVQIILPEPNRAAGALPSFPLP